MIENIDNTSRDDWNISHPHFLSDEINSSLGVSPWSGHRNFAYDLMAFIRPSRVVELGTHYGASFFAFLQAGKDFQINAEFVAVDTWVGEEHAGHYGEEVFDIVNSTIREFFEKQNVRLLRKTFDNALSDVEDGSIDLLHIDGFHSYEAVSYDYLTWLPKLSKNGIVLFHDIAPSSGYGSAKFWEDTKKKHPYFEFLDHSFGLGVLFPNGKEKYSEIAKCLNKNILDLYRYKSEFHLKYKQYEDAKKQLEDRWMSMQSMETMIRERDEAIDAQARMLEERWLVMQSMEAMIRERDDAIIELQSSLEKESTSSQPKDELQSIVKRSLLDRIVQLLEKRR